MFLIALPLHFVFNSAVYKTAGMNTYNITLITAEYASRTYKRIADDSNLFTSLHDPQINTEWEEISLVELERRRSNELPTAFRNAVVVWAVTDDTNRTIVDQWNMLGVDLQQRVFMFPDWISGSIDQNGETQFIWKKYPRKPGEYGRIHYPLKATGFSEKFKPECRLLANPLFWWLTAVCNLTIAVSITGMVYFYKSTPLVTVGDAIDSFLTKPSEYVPKSACTYVHTAFANMFRPSLVARSQRIQGILRGRWQAVGLTRWWYTTLWFCFIIFALVNALIAGCSLRTTQEMFSTGLGAGFSQATGVIERLENPSPATNEFGLVAIANTPQFITSLSYIYYNIILTTMVSECEWQRIGQKRGSSSLRVSTPRGHQRSSYFLSLTYRYGIPLLIMTTVEKWFASLGLFYIVLDIWNADGVREGDGPTTVMPGYSSLAILILTILMAVSWMDIVLLGIVRSYPAGKPLLGSCSGVTAASCHLSATDMAKRDAGEDIAAGPLSWGVIKQVHEDGEEEQWLGFMTGEEAEMPKDGEVYG